MDKVSGAIAFYVWTDTQIINAAQICRTRASHDGADLYVLKLERVSDALLQAVGESGVFDGIYEIAPPEYEKLCRRPLRLPGLKTVQLGRLYQRYFNARVDTLCPKRAYAEVLIPGFWAESLHFLRALRRRGSFTVLFFEEGMYSYVKDCFLCRIDDPKKEKFERGLRYGAFYSRARRAVEGICLFRPEDMKMPSPASIRAIPPIDVNESFWQTLFSRIVTPEEIEAYRSRRYIYLIGAHKADYEPDSQRAEQLLGALVDAVGAENVAVRFHPSLHPDDGEYRSRFGSDLFLDRQPYWFEGACALVGLGGKVMITRNSSVLPALAAMNAEMPHIILTYKLFDYYSMHGDKFRDDLAEQLRARAITDVPESEAELLALL